MGRGPLDAHDFHAVAVMYFADRFAYLRQRFPEDYVAVGYVSDRNDLRNA